MEPLEPFSEQLRTQWRRPRSLTALVPIPSVHSRSELHQRLLTLAPEFQKALPGIGGLHSFRLVAAPPLISNMPFRVLFNSVYDQPLAGFFPALLKAVGPALVDAFSGADFSGRPEDVPSLLLRYRQPENTLHLGAINQPVEDILAEQRLLEVVGDFADQRVATGSWPAGTAAEAIRLEIRAHALAQPESAKLPRAAAASLPASARALRFLDLLATFAFPAIGVLAVHIANAIRRLTNPGTRLLAWVGYGLWWIYGAIPTGFALLFVRLLEFFESDVLARPSDPAKVARLEDQEDQQLTNTVTYWFAVRPTFIRRILLWVILWGSERGCRHFWTNGALADIDTIHYARILWIDGGRSMLFLSDYDGSLDRYLLDFLGVGSSAVIPISSNVNGCAKTRWLFNPEDPSTFGPRLCDLLRLSQLETPVWFNAYPNLSVRDVLANAALREGLFATQLSEADAAQWLAQL